MPERAEVYVKDDRAFVVESRLKVMLEEDYVALQAKQQVNSEKLLVNSKKTQNTTDHSQNTVSNNKLASDIVREIVIPALEKEVNEGYRFVVVAGGGWTAREYQNAARNLGKPTELDLDMLGIHATRINAFLLKTVLGNLAHPKNNLESDPAKLNLRKRF